MEMKCVKFNIFYCIRIVSDLSRNLVVTKEMYKFEKKSNIRQRLVPLLVSNVTRVKASLIKDHRMILDKKSLIACRWNLLFISRLLISFVDALRFSSALGPIENYTSRVNEKHPKRER